MAALDEETVFGTQLVPFHCKISPLLGAAPLTGLFCNLVTVVAPVFVMLTSPLKDCELQFAPFAIRMFLSVGVVEPRVAPLILATTVAPCVPVTSPARLPVKLVVVPLVISERRATVPVAAGRVIV